jgi:hypothetical protein
MRTELIGGEKGWSPVRWKGQSPQHCPRERIPTWFVSVHGSVALATMGAAWNRKKRPLAPQEGSPDTEEGCSGPGGRPFRTGRKAVQDRKEGRSGPGGRPFRTGRKTVQDREEGRPASGMGII